MKSDPHYVLVFLVIGFGLLALVLGIIWGKMYITERKLRGTLLRGESDRWHEMAWKKKINNNFYYKNFKL